MTNNTNYDDSNIKHTLDINKMKVDELRRHLKTLGLDTKGKKQDLIDRIKNSLYDNNISPSNVNTSNDITYVRDRCLGASDYEQMRIVDLKPLLKQLNLKQTGSKAELVSRICEHYGIACNNPCGSAPRRGEHKKKLKTIEIPLNSSGKIDYNQMTVSDLKTFLKQKGSKSTSHKPKPRKNKDQSPRAASSIPVPNFPKKNTRGIGVAGGQ